MSDLMVSSSIPLYYSLRKLYIVVNIFPLDAVSMWWEHGIQTIYIAYPSFSILCLLHMFIAVCRTSTPSVRRLTTMPSISGPARQSCLSERERKGQNGKYQDTQTDKQSMNHVSRHSHYVICTLYCACVVNNKRTVTSYLRFTVHA